MSRLRRVLSYNLFANVFVLRVLIIFTIALMVYQLVGVATAITGGGERGPGYNLFFLTLLAFFGLILTRALKKIEKIGQKKPWKVTKYFFLVILVAIIILIAGVALLFRLGDV